MDTQQLRYLLAVIDTGSYQRAAAELGITQSAITKSVVRLEENLGVTLLNRGRHGATPTALGSIFALRARSICADEVMARTELSDLVQGERGHVRIGLGIAFANGLMPHTIAAFQRKYPRAPITVIEGMSPELFIALREGKLDFVVSSPIDRLVEHSVEFEQKFLFNDTDHIVASQKHPLAKEEHVPFTALRDYPWVISQRVPALRELLWRRFRKFGVAPPEQVILSDSVQLAKRLAEKHNYLVILSREFIRYEEVNGVLCALAVDDFTPNRAAILSYRRGFEPTATIKAFIDLLLEYSEGRHSKTE